MNPVREAIFSLLDADATLSGLAPGGVHHKEAPLNSGLPVVVFQKLSGVPEWTFGGKGSELQNDIWQAKAIGVGASAGAAEDAAERIDTILSDAELTISGKTGLYLRRVSDIDYPEQSGAETYHHVGGSYRLYTTPA